MLRPSFFFSPKKKICKNKKYLPTISAKESALIPIVKYLNQICKYNSIIPRINHKPKTIHHNMNTRNRENP
jgi:hypothetical protein